MQPHEHMLGCAYTNNWAISRPLVAPFGLVHVPECHISLRGPQRLSFCIYFFAYSLTKTNLMDSITGLNAPFTPRLQSSKLKWHRSLMHSKMIALQKHKLLCNTLLF